MKNGFGNTITFFLLGCWAILASLVMLGGGEFDAKLILLIWVAAFAVIVHLLLDAISKKDKNLIYFFAPATAYFGGAWLLKAIIVSLGISAGETTLIGLTSIYEEKAFDTALVAAMGTSLAGCAGLLATAFAIPANPQFSKLRKPLNLKTILMVCVVSLFIKYFCHYILKWGIPGAEPENPIEGVTGVTSMYVRTGLFGIVCLAIYLATISNKVSQQLITAVVAIGYVFLDLGIGSKYSLVYLAFVFGCLAFRKSPINGKRSARLIAISAVFAVFASLIYGTINYYRFARLSGITDFRESFDFVMHYKSQGNQNMDLSFTGRINGFEGFYHLVQNSDTLTARIHELFVESNFAGDYTTSLTGVQNDTNAAGSTQSGIIYLICRRNVWMAFLLMLAITFVVSMVVSCSIRIFLSDSGARTVGYMVAGIFAVYVQFGSGNLLFFGKEWFVIAVCLTCAGAGGGRRLIAPYVSQRA